MPQQRVLSQAVCLGCVVAVCRAKAVAHMCMVRTLLAGSEFAEAVRYAAKVWLPAKQVRQVPPVIPERAAVCLRSAQPSVAEPALACADSLPQLSGVCCTVPCL
jgi:hypothetical protein